MSQPHIYNMPSGLPFLPLLAEGLTQHFGDDLQRALILLPTRRAVRAMQAALANVAKAKGKGATLLPRMRPLADINPEEPPFEPGELIGQVPPALSNVQRRFEMAKLVAVYHRRAADLPLDPSAALALADPLLAIMDDAAMEEVSITESDEWRKIMSDSALHFQHAATLYKIIETYWPKRLKELGLMEGQARKVKLLNLLTKSWSDKPPSYPVIIAGSTGTLKATAKLMACVARMPQGMIVMPGLQTTTDQTWDSIDIQHPQWSMKNLLNLVEMDRDDVGDFRDLTQAPKDKTNTDFRRMVINEALVAVDKTSDWLGRINKLKTDHGADVFAKAMDGLSLITAANDEDEALTIALIMRETLNRAGETTALVTPDQALARRVQTRLKRWNISVDMSQGEPLAQTLIGEFLTAILQLANDPESPLLLSVIFNHPICRLGLPEGEAKSQWQVLERRVGRDTEKPTYRGVRPRADAQKPDLVVALLEALDPLLQLKDSTRANVWASALVNVAEKLASSSIWDLEEGHEAASILEGLMAHGGELPNTNAEGMQRLLHRMMRNTIVRRQEGNQPRLSILGPLEARLITADTIVLGGLNEGVWPAAPSVDPFLSRQMRKEMDLSLPERRYGLSAHDFAEFAANGRVFLTRSERSDSGPTVASRWVWRLRTLLEGAIGGDTAKTLLATGDLYLNWAKQIDFVAQNETIDIPPPNFAPPVDKRWVYYKGEKQSGDAGRRMSITQVQTWIRDPYAVYANRALGLERLDELDMPNDARQFGNAVHKAIETFLGPIGKPLTDESEQDLLAHLKTAFEDEGYAPELIAHEQARFENMSRDILIWLRERNALGYDVIESEAYGNYVLPAHNFRLTGVADLVERGPEGYAFFDFKTGIPSSAQSVDAGFDPQLPLAAFLAEMGAFEDFKAGDTRQLGYVRVKGSNDGFEEKIVSGPEGTINRKPAKDAMQLSVEAADTLRKLIEDYDRADKAYPSQPRVKFSNTYGDYDHLARRPEWRGVEDDGGEGET